MAEIFFLPLGALIVGIALPTVAYLLIACFEGFPKLRLRQVAGIVAFSAWIMAPISMSAEPYFFFTGLILLMIFFVTWRNEFCRLMLRREDDFPGRWDKLGWFLMLTITAPAGVWLFRSFRKARWPETSVPKPSTGPNPWDHDDVEELSPATARIG